MILRLSVFHTSTSVSIIKRLANKSHISQRFRYVKLVAKIIDLVHILLTLLKHSVNSEVRLNSVNPHSSSIFSNCSHFER